MRCPGFPALAAALLLAVPARAAAPVPAAAPAQPVTSAQASALLDVLNDPQKRAQFTATLQAMTRALPATQAAATPATPGTASGAPPDATHDATPGTTPGTTAGATTDATPGATPGTAAPAAPAPVRVPLRPDSLGAALVTQSSSWFTALSVQAVSLGRAVGDFPLFEVWVRHMAQDPDARARVINASWTLAVVLAVSIGLEVAAWFGLRRPLAALEAWAPEGSGEPGDTGLDADLDPARPPAFAEAAPAAGSPAPALPSPATLPPADLPPPTGPMSDAEVAAAAVDRAEQRQAKRQQKRHRTLRALRRLPFALLRLTLELIPVGVFLIAANLLLAAGLGATDLTRDVVMVNIEAWAAVRVAMCVVRTLLSPARPRLRLLHVTDAAAGYLLAWIRRLLLVAVFGNAVLDVGLLFGLYREAHDALLKLVALAVHLMLVVVVLQCRGTVAARLRAGKHRHGTLARVLNRLAAVWHWIAIFYLVALWVVWATELRNGYTRLLHFFFVTVAVTITARLLGILVLGGLDRAVRVSPELAARYPGLEARTGRYYPVARALLIGLLVALTAVALLEVWGVDSLGWFSASQLGPRIVSAAITILISGVLAIGIWEGVNTAADRQLARLGRDAQIVRAARLRTLMPILRTALFVALAVVLGLTVLSQVGVNIAPLLAGAGIVGVAIGFGSQKLVQDFITGIFLLLENAMQVGDAVTVAGLSGTVETLSIRTIRLRAGDGSVHIIPFSSVTTVNNANRDFANADVTVGVAYREDTDRVGAVLASIVMEMRGDPAFSDRILGDLNLWGVDALGDFAVTVKGQIRTTAGGRWPVQREFNRRMKKRFEAEGIDIPFPVRTLLTPDLRGGTVPAPASGWKEEGQGAALDPAGGAASCTSAGD